MDIRRLFHGWVLGTKFLTGTREKLSWNWGLTQLFPRLLLFNCSTRRTDPGFAPCQNPIRFKKQWALGQRKCFFPVSIIKDACNIMWKTTTAFPLRFKDVKYFQTAKTQKRSITCGNKGRNNRKKLQEFAKFALSFVEVGLKLILKMAFSIILFPKFINFSITVHYNYIRGPLKTCISYTHVRYWL